MKEASEYGIGNGIHQLRKLAMTADWENLITVNLDDCWLHDGCAGLCMVQPTPIKECELLESLSRPVNLQTVYRLLDGDGEPALGEFIPANRPAILCFPELAFIPSDWECLDRLVRSYKGRLILAAGFGFASGPSLRDWASSMAGSSTIRKPIWDDSHLNSTSQYNGAWIWVKSGKETLCCTILKNYPAANIEFKNVQNWQGGQWMLSLKAPDVTIYPMICFDILREGQNAPVDRVLANIQQERPSNALILGMLLQGAPYHSSWSSGLNRFFRRTGEWDTRTAVALCHYAYDTPDPEENKDSWRSLTGIYRPLSQFNFWDDEKYVRLNVALDPTRLMRDEQVAGVVVRQTEPGVIGGSVPFKYKKGNECFAWAANKAYPLDAQGAVRFDQIPSQPPAYEAIRILRRHKKIETHPFGPIAKEAVAALTVKLKSHETAAIAKRLCVGIPIGDCPETPSRLDPDQLAKREDDWLPSVLVLAALMNAGNMSACPDSTCLDLALDNSAPIWRAWQAKALTHHQIHEKLRHLATAPDDIRSMVVIVRGDGSFQPENKVFGPSTIRHTDRPANTKRRQDRATPVRKIRCLPWTHFSADVLLDQDRKRAVGALQSLLQDLDPQATIS